MNTMITVDLIDITEKAEEKIGKYMAIVHDAELSFNAGQRRLHWQGSEIDNSHLRFAYATFKIEGISRVCSHDLVGSERLCCLQKSQREVDESEAAMVVPTSEITKNKEIKALYEEAIETAQEAYKDLRAVGIPREEALFVLPEAIVTELYITGDFQAWRRFIDLQGQPETQWEVKTVAVYVLHKLHKTCPILFPLGLIKNDGELNGMYTRS